MRTDLRLEALCDVMDGNIWVHCHCYRADEILRLLDVAEDHGFRIAVLQHILEGYRIAPEIHRHGCSGSTFSDWWAYKIEAFNAVPHNAARMKNAKRTEVLVVHRITNSATGQRKGSVCSH